MQTPVLTKNQQKQSLSGKKKGRDKFMRNVLVKPKGNTDIVVDTATAEGIFKVLESCMKLCSETSCQTVEQTLSMQIDSENSITSNKKRVTKQKLKVQLLKESGLRRHLFFGVNAVARAVEKGNARSVLLEKDVDPAFMVSHIGTLCSVHDVPCVLLPGLKSYTQKECGFPCICLGLKECGSNESDLLCDLQHTITQAFVSFTPKKQSSTFPENEEAADSEIVCTENTDNYVETKPSVENVQQKKFSTDIYKYRSSTKERIFLPSKTQKITEDFIPIDKDVVNNTQNDYSWQPITGISANFSIKRSRQPLESDKSEIDKRDTSLGVEYTHLEIKRMRANPNKKKKIK